MAKDAVPDAPDISLGAFLQDNYRLFAIMSVFGGVSALLLTVATDLAEAMMGFVVHLGIVTSLLLFVLVAYTINRRFFATYVNLKILFTHPDTRSKVASGVFLLLFDVLVLCAGAIVLYYSDAFWALVGVLAFPCAVFVMYRVQHHTMVWLKIRFRTIGWDPDWETLDSITMIGYGVLIAIILVYLAETNGYLFDPGMYLQDHPLSLVFLILFGGLIGLPVGSTLSVEEAMDRRLQEAERDLS